MYLMTEKKKFEKTKKIDKNLVKRLPQVASI